MTIAIPHWMMIRYSALYREFKSGKSFDRKEAKEVFNKHKIKSKDDLTNTFFSELNKKGWVKVSKDKNDSRKKFFKLISPDKAILDLELKE